MESKKTTKIDLVESIHKNPKKNQYDRKVIQDVAQQLLDAIKESLGRGETIELRGFGTFRPVLRKGRKNARNPKTGETIKSVAPHYIASFQAGQDLKKAMMELEVKEE